MILKEYLFSQKWDVKGVGLKGAEPLRIYKFFLSIPWMKV